MNPLNGIEDFIRRCPFVAGVYEVHALDCAGQGLLLRLRFADKDEPLRDGVRQVATIELPQCNFVLPPQRPTSDQAEAEDIHQRVFSALVRAGAQHPGLRVEDLRRLHQAARREHYIELFSDLNALTTGLLGHLVGSLGTRVSRVVVASSSIDILHEYQSLSRHSAARRRAHAEMARALALLDQLRIDTPVHIHQLPPGASRYFKRKGGDSSAGEEHHAEQGTSVSEDRQMVAAFWDYQQTSNPRLPVFLITSDFSLAHVCHAERVPYLFARSPHEVRKQQAHKPHPLQPKTLFFDPFALALRFCAPHYVLWELALIFRRINIVPVPLNGVPTAEGLEPATSEGPAVPPQDPQEDTPAPPLGPFSLCYEGARHWPGEHPPICLGPLLQDSPAVPASANQGPDTSSRGDDGATPGGGQGRLRVKLDSLLAVLPTRPRQSRNIASFPSKDEDQLRQLRQIGEQTGLFSIDGEKVLAGDRLNALLNALKKNDYISVNDIFRRQPAYGRLLDSLASGEPFPPSRVAGTAPGWAIMLGAVYKTKEGVHYGLAEIGDVLFATTVRETHSEISQGMQAVPLPRILDQVCQKLKISPVRFEAMLLPALRSGELKDFEVQRATIQEDIPQHPILVWPEDARTAKSYLRVLEPGRGLLLGGTLYSSLVRRSEVA